MPRRVDPAEPSAPGAAGSNPADTHARLPVPEPLAPLIPYGTLRAGSSLAVTGAARTSLLLALASAAAGADAWCAIAGMPDLGLRGALDGGLDPTRLALVPDSGSTMPQVLSALIDGVGVVVLGPSLTLSPSLWRTLLGRARTHDTLVLAVDPPGRADLQLSVEGLGWTGIGTGGGRLRRRRIEVSAQGRGIAGQRTARMILPDVRGLLAADPAATATAGVRSVEPIESPELAEASAAALGEHAGLRMVRRAG